LKSSRSLAFHLILRSAAQRSVSKDGNAKDGATRQLPPFETLRFAPFLRERWVCGTGNAFDFESLVRRSHFTLSEWRVFLAVAAPHDASLE